MNRVNALVVALLVLLPLSTAKADEQSNAQALDLFEVMNMEHVMEEAINQMLDIQTQQNSALSQFRPIMQEFFAKYH